MTMEGPWTPRGCQREAGSGKVTAGQAELVKIARVALVIDAVIIAAGVQGERDNAPDAGLGGFHLHGQGRVFRAQTRYRTPLSQRSAPCGRSSFFTDFSISLAGARLFLLGGGGGHTLFPGLGAGMGLGADAQLQQADGAGLDGKFAARLADGGLSEEAGFVGGYP